MAEKAQQDPQCSWFFTGVTVFWGLKYILFYKTVLCDCKHIFFSCRLLGTKVLCFFLDSVYDQENVQEQFDFCDGHVEISFARPPFSWWNQRESQDMNYLAVDWIAFCFEVSHFSLIFILLTFSLQSMASGREARSTSDWKTAPEPWLSLRSFQLSFIDSKKENIQ